MEVLPRRTKKVSHFNVMREGKCSSWWSESSSPDPRMGGWIFFSVRAVPASD